MPTSYNGWTASPNLSDLDTVRIEPVNGRSFIVRQVAAPLFAYLIRRFHAEVDPITGGVMDEWSYSYRKGRATNALSCHASATAVDLDATQFPMGRTNMTARQRSAVRSILAATRRMFRWGGDFNRGYEDEMHFELAKGTTPTTVRKAIAAMALHSDGRVLQPNDLRAGGHPTRIRLLKRALAKVGLYPKRPVYSGTWNLQLARAWDTYRKRRPSQSRQERLDALGAVTHLF